MYKVLIKQEDEIVIEGEFPSIIFAGAPKGECGQIVGKIAGSMDECILALFTVQVELMTKVSRMKKE